MGAEFGFGGGGVDARFGVGRDDGGSMKLAAMEFAMKKTAVVRPRLPATVLPPVTSHTYITSGEAPHFIRRSFTCQFVLAPFGSVPCSTIQNLFGIHVEGEEFLLGGVGIEEEFSLSTGARKFFLFHICQMINHFRPSHLSSTSADVLSTCAKTVVRSLP